MLTQKVIDHGWKRIERQFSSFKQIDVKIGLFGSGNSPKNNVAYRGLVHQEPSPSSKTPRRPFMSNAFDEEEYKIKGFIKNEFGKVIDGKQTINQMIKRVGNMHEGQMKRSFTKYNYIELKEATIKRKKSSQPLIDTAVMRNSIKFKVEYK